MSARTIDLERLEAQVKLWHAEMDYLRQKVRGLASEQGTVASGRAGEMQPEMFGDKLDLLQQLLDKADDALRKLAAAGEDDWEVRQQQAEHSLNSLGETFEAFRSRFRE